MSALASLLPDLKTSYAIDPKKFDQLDVKLGLRNQDGSGVLAGLTTICSVIGSQKTAEAVVSVDGELTFRGISIFEVVATCQKAGRFGLERTSFLLLVGRWPTEDELISFCDSLQKNRSVPTALMDILSTVPVKNVMNTLELVVSVLYTLGDPDPDSQNPEENFSKLVGVLAKLPVIIANAYRKAQNPQAPWVTPPIQLTTAESFLYCLRGGHEASALETQILDLCLILQTEHGGGNNSTFATRVVTSSGTDFYSSMNAGLASLKGPLHGGANAEVMGMMDYIKSAVLDWSDEDQIRDCLKSLIQKQAYDKSGKLYGLGHAVYTKSDPRAILLQEQARALARAKNRGPEFSLYLSVAKEGPKLFNEIKGSQKTIAPNVDFFSGFVYDCLGIDPMLYTPIFAMARLVGWSAHRLEEIMSPKPRIMRPAYKYISRNS